MAVLAARGGTVQFDGCLWPDGSKKGYVRVDHLDGYSTVYYHLINIPSFTDGVSHVDGGQFVGNQGTSTDCGGPPLCGTCAHVHFSLYYTPSGTQFSALNPLQQVDLNNIQYSDWIVAIGSAQYYGCMLPILGGSQQCVNPATGQTGQIYNSGRVGGSAPAETTASAVVTMHGSDGAGWAALYAGAPWASIGGGLVGNLAEISFNNEVNVFARGTDGAVYRNVRNQQTGWSGWNYFGIQATSDPVVTIYNNSLQLLIRGTDGQVWQRYATLSGTTVIWSSWTSLGGALYGKPAIGSLGSLFQIVVRGTDDALWQKYYNGGWSGWASLGGLSGTSSDPNPDLAVVTGALDVLVRGGDGSVWQNYESLSGGTYVWNGWQPMGGLMIGSPSAVVLGNQFFIIVHGTDGMLWQRVYTNGVWGAWTQLSPVTATSDPVIADVFDSLQLLVRGSDGAVWMNSNTGAGWTGWGSIGGAAA